MRRVLYLAFYFPPQGGAGVQRTLKFVRYLPAHGWRATVVTARADYWMRDPSLLAEVAPDLLVLRAGFPGARFLAGGRRPVRTQQGGAPGAGTGVTPGAGTDGVSPSRPEPASARSAARVRLLRGVARFLLVPDAYTAWARAARRLAERELRTRRYDAIVTTSSPDSAHLAGRALRRSSGLPWVADFRDPWTRRLSYAPPTPVHDRWQRGLERACLREADRVVVTSEETRADFLALDPALSPDRIRVITNGFDQEDFARAEALDPEALAWIPSGGIAILHAGQLNPERPLAPFLAGFRQYFDGGGGREQDTRLWCVGGHYDRDREAVRRFGLQDRVVFAGNRPHLESVAALGRARSLLLLEHDSDRGRLILPGKVFEYLRSRRPILAIVPRDGAAHRLIRSLDAGVWADPKDPASVAEAIARVLAWGSNPVALAALEIFERQSLAGRLAALLDEVAGPSGSVTA